MRKLLLVLVFLLPVAAQTGAALKIDDIVALLEAKMPESVILNKIAASGQTFDLSTADLIRLKKAGASEAVLLRLTSPPAAVPAAPSAVAMPMPEASGAPAGDVGQFREIGVYFRKGSEWLEVQPEIVNWKTGGTLKGIATVGIVKKDVNGHIAGQHSRNSVKSPLEFVISAPEGVAITEYQLIRLRTNPDKDYREFRTITGGVFNQRSGAMRDMVPFEGKRIAQRQFSIILPPTLGAGEYGFVYMGATGSAGSTSSMSMGKMYTFRLLE